uniref:Uncharacterized protein n=1 Tax=Rhizophora mucronata TaxID=61149 RepID=A0A2P2PMX1_RHIMU
MVNMFLTNNLIMQIPIEFSGHNNGPLNHFYTALIFIIPSGQESIKQKHRSQVECSE